MRRCWSIVPVLLVASGASAQTLRPATAWLEWRRAPGAESCLDGAGLGRAVAQFAGREVLHPARAGADLVVAGTVRREGRGWAAALVMTSLGGEELGRRELVSAAPDCARLDEPLALVVALALESLSAARATLTVPARPLRAGPAWGGVVTARALGGLGLLPDGAVGLGLASRVTAGRLWPVELGLALWLPRRTTVEGHGAELTGWQASLGLCPRLLARGRLGLDACAGVGAGELRATGVGLEAVQRPRSVIVDVRARLGASFGLTRHLALAAGVGLEVPLVRDRFVFEAGTSRELVHRPAPVNGTADLGLAVRLP